ncbi:MAG TPA: hypothetical protein VFD98_09125 [Terracidiphilus sp.]|jgi:hypothetical protein|nr:hypothetical protein [Terracidiphilus sp.]
MKYIQAKNSIRATRSKNVQRESEEADQPRRTLPINLKRFAEVHAVHSARPFDPNESLDAD